METRYVTLINLKQKNHYANVLKYVVLKLEGNQNGAGSFLI